MKLKFYSVTLLSILLGFSLTGCNTVKGVGKDMQKGGEKLSQAAEKHGAS